MFSDGTGVVDGTSMTWKVENKRLMLLTSSKGIVCDYKVSGYGLVLTYDDKNSATFVKKGQVEEYKKKREEEKQKETARVKKEVGLRLEKISGYFTDSRNGQKYRTVKIGGKTWMAENLNYQTGNSWCYGGDSSNCTEYGRLYDWNTAKTACPAGWHLPSNQEWNDLVTIAGGDTAGRALKSAYGWEEKGNGADGLGFSALPSGFGCVDSNSNGAGYGGYGGLWWTATDVKSGPVVREIFFHRDIVDESNGEKWCDELIRMGVMRSRSTLVFSVRCVAD